MPAFPYKLAFILCLSFFLSACTKSLDSLGSYLPSFSNEKKGNYDGWTAEQFITAAQEALDDENYKKAVTLLEQLDSRYPFGSHSTKAQLDLTYAYYKGGFPESALASADRFIKTNPRHPNIDYAYYLKALINFNRQQGFVDRFVPSDVTQRDTLYIEKAHLNFAELVRRFPDSIYLQDALQRMVYLTNAIARHELHVARFYMDREAYVAAAGRANFILEHYPNTPSVPYALEIQIKAYRILGLKELEENSSQIYRYNYPDGPLLPEEDASETVVIPFIWDVLGFDD